MSTLNDYGNDFPVEKVSNFLNKELVNYASYSTLRMIGSAIDGQKNSSRKVLRTVLDKNIRNEIKVSQLGPKCAEYTEYLHGNIDNVIVSMAQNFAGTNNLPLLSREGNFGTRFTNEASATRYIFTNGEKETFKIFKKEDEDVLEKQFFEGNEIEPKFYTPTIPMILVNGSVGVATGFAQLILSRDAKQIKNFLENRLKGDKKPFNLLPSFNGFSGNVKNEETNSKFSISGLVEKTSAGKVTINELPIGYDLKGYIKVLDKLEDTKKIKSYKDLSDKNSFKFEVNLLSTELSKLSDDDLIDYLKLKKLVSENYTCVDKDNKIIVFKDVSEIFDYYYDVRIDFYTKRKKFRINELNEKISFLKDRINFIQNVNDDKIIINKRAYENIVQQCKENNIKHYDSHLKLNILSLTLERVEELKTQLGKFLKELEVLEVTKVEEIWLSELKELEV